MKEARKSLIGQDRAAGCFSSFVLKEHALLVAKDLYRQQLRGGAGG